MMHSFFSHNDVSYNIFFMFSLNLFFKPSIRVSIIIGILKLLHNLSWILYIYIYIFQTSKKIQYIVH